MSDQGPLRERIKGIGKVLESAVRLTDASFVSQHFKVEGDVAVYLAVMAEASTIGMAQPVVTLLRPHVAPAKVSADLTARAKKKELADADVLALDAMSMVDIEWNWDVIAPALQEILGADTTLQASELTTFLGVALVLERLHGSEHVRAMNSELVAKGHVMFHFFDAESNGDVRAQALCAEMSLLHMPEGGAATRPGNVASGAALFTEFTKNPEAKADVLANLVNLIVRHKALAEVLDRAESDLLGALAVIILRQVIDESGDLATITPALLLEKWATLEAVLTAEQFKVVLERSIDDGLVHEVVGRGFVSSQSNAYQSIALSAEERADSSATETLREFLQEGLMGVDRETWNTALRENGPIVDLLAFAQSWQPAPKLGDALAHALDELTRDVHSGSFELPSRDDWEEVLRSLAPALFRTRLANARDLVRSSSGPLERLLGMYGEMIYEADWEDGLDEIVRMRFPEVLARNSSEEFLWMSNLGRRFRTSKSLLPDTLSDFEGRLQRAVVEAADDERVSLLDIAQAWEMSIEVTEEGSQGGDGHETGGPSEEAGTSDE